LNPRQGDDFVRAIVHAAASEEAMRLGKGTQLDPTELERLVYRNRRKYKGSRSIREFDLGGLANARIITIAQAQSRRPAAA
jgi:hypothetical protein